MEEKNQPEELNQDSEEIGNEKISPAKEILSFVKTTVIFLAVFLVIIHFIARPIIVQGASMENTCHDGDYMIIWEFGYEPQKGDVIVIDKDNLLGKRLVKRVIAVGGDRLQLQNGELTINGELQEESYLKDQVWGQENDIDITIPENEIFVMGDNRNDSADSRVIGTLSEKAVMGKVVVRLFPFDKIGQLA